MTNKKTPTVITIIGASGHVGGAIARSLIESEVNVRAIGRSRESLNHLATDGADVRIGDISETPWLTDTLRGSDAVFAMVPSNPFSEEYDEEQDRLGESVSTALRESAVPTVVALSSAGADHTDAPGVIGALHRQELRLADLPARVGLLRPVSFFENFDAAVEQLTVDSSHVDSVHSDLPLPMITTADIARVAVTALLDASWSGHVAYELLGERDLSYNEATAILGRCMGIDDARYIQLPYNDMASVLTQEGFSAQYARHYVDMVRAFNSGELTNPVPRTIANTTPTSFEQFARALYPPVGRVS